MLIFSFLRLFRAFRWYILIPKKIQKDDLKTPLDTSSSIKVSKMFVGELHVTLINTASPGGRDRQTPMSVRIQSNLAACIAPQNDHKTMRYAWCALRGEHLPCSGASGRTWGLPGEIFPSPEKVEGPHTFRKWRLLVGTHQDSGLLSIPAASQLYNPQAQPGSSLQCFLGGFWW